MLSTNQMNGKGYFTSAIICLFLLVGEVSFHRLVGHFYFFFVDFLFLSLH